MLHSSHSDISLILVTCITRIPYYQRYIESLCSDWSRRSFTLTHDVHSVTLYAITSVKLAVQLLVCSNLLLGFASRQDG